MLLCVTIINAEKSNLMNIVSLEWDDENVEHISRHYVTPAEVVDVCFEPHIAYSGANNRYILYGQTGDGRYLKVVLKRLHGARFRPITAFDMSESEKHNYRKKFK